MTSPHYYADKIDSLKEIFGARNVETRPEAILVDGRTYPVVNDVIVALHPSRWPPTLAAHEEHADSEADPVSTFAVDIQQTFGGEWKKFNTILPEHEEWFCA